ncbi:coproporphyrinogen III oxidase [Microbacterium sp. AISO3]|jgi:putative oxygen-independent coproporphyrinogen III oxidase|uniref:Heme chaperone HemW n=2 Tax=Microbacterium TaxID=33882 RepID=A0ABU1HXP6_9MICO|nr:MULTISPECIES: radical SAM family heme chaperone HemW [Microbacterium]APF33278.1 coproporphyrinogen III oxidase [Microbacterium paludicola]MDR6166404.1 putative oxygen-independent coproporphyrinogen III oxidase [Microbacterium paludicola]OAZ39615.1 coproporphyrinogen III oxidase [Microbacterium arborescens]OWP22911.1 coproporphyrinogen III oxidase [Microbacterium sp. AISO3]POX66961.1 coproporphyrinogen III oxidase [Microbacterium sp. Ru50]
MGAALPIGDPVPAGGTLPDDLVIDPDVPFGVYLHVPFCRVRCGYCDFNTYTATELRGARQDAYADEVLREIALSASVIDERGPRRPAQTVFFGGGTPTLLPAGDLARMLRGVRDTFGIAAGAEVTVEANPDTMSARVADELAAAGVTRLSIGMQSAVPHVLAALDRTHDPANVSTAVAAARGAGLDVSVDLIYGAPGESLDDWRRSVDTAVALEPDHVSAYALIIEEGTRLERQIRRGEVAAPDDDLQADMYELADDRLAVAGFSWYEVSNWARSADQRSRHNLAYWRGTDWWGYGPGAHSHLAGLRWWNVKHPAAYAQRLAAGDSPAAGRERPDADARRLESVLLRSRIVDGLAIDDLDADARPSVASLIADGLIEGAAAVRGRVVLTRRGRLMADAVVRALTE